VRCAANVECCDAEKIDGQYVGADTDRAVCDRCERMIHRSIVELSTDYVALHVAQRTGVVPATGELVLSSRDLPVPISLSFLTLAEQIAHEAVAFAEPVAERLGITARHMSRCRWGATPRYRSGVLLSRAVHLLTVALPTLLALPATAFLLWGTAGRLVAVEVTGVIAALRLAALHRAARSAIGVTRHATWLPVPCPTCGAQTVVRYAGSDNAACQSCNGRWSERDYRRWTLVLAHEHGG
jgi:hypothetical protein